MPLRSIYFYAVVSYMATTCLATDPNENLHLGGTIAWGIDINWDIFNWNRRSRWGGDSCRDNSCDWFDDDRYDGIDQGFYGGRGYSPTTPGCMQNQNAWGCRNGPSLPPNLPTIQQCDPRFSGCPGGPQFQGCTAATAQLTPGCSYGGQITPIPGCNSGIQGCPGFRRPIPGCPDAPVVPGCQFASPGLPGCPGGPIPAGCYPNIPYARNFRAVDNLSISLAKNNASDDSVPSSTTPSTTTTATSSSSTTEAQNQVYDHPVPVSSASAVSLGQVVMHLPTVSFVLSLLLS